MIEDAATDTGLEPEMTAVEATRESVLDSIARRRNEREDHQLFDIPSWGGELKARYRILGKRDIDEMVQRARARQMAGSKINNVDGDIMFLIKACSEVVACPADTGDEITVSEGYTMELAATLKPKDQFGNELEIREPKHLVAHMFGKEDSSIAIASHAMQVVRWMQDPSRPIADPL